MRKIFTFLFAALMSVGMWALTPKSGDTWDETTKTLTVNSNPEDYAYWGESDIENLVISDAVTSIGVSAFEECSALTSVTIGNSVTSIGNSAFYSCYLLTSVEIPNSVEEIGVQAFASCSELTSVTIGNGVTSIGDYAFVDCSGLETVTINAESLESYGTDAFEGTAEDLTIYVPAGSVDTYKAGWAAYEDKIVAIPVPEPSYIDADFAIDFRTDPYSVSGTMPTGTNIAGTYHDNLHGYQNVIATVPVKAGKYRLTLGACEYDSNAGTVMSETNVELASFDQNLGTGKCYHNNTTKNIVSVIFDVDEDQHVAIQCGQYTPYMKLEAVTSYAVEFALGDAEGTAPTALDVTVGEDITMPVNKTLYKAGYTLTGWSDGVNTYAIGNSFTPANDVVLTPVFTANQADLLNASSDVTVKWYFGGDNGAPTTSYEGTSGLLVAQATIGDKTVDVKLSIDATSGKFAPQPTTEWAQVNVGTIFTYPYKEGITVNVDNYKSYVTYYIADAEGEVACGENDYYSFIEVTYPASTPGPSTAIDNANANANTVKVIRNGMLLIEKNGHIINVLGQPVR